MEPTERREHVFWRRVRRVLGIAAGLGVLALALALLHHELRNYHLHDIRAAIRGIPWSSIAKALALTAASYALLTGYDVLALRHIRHPLPYGKTAVTSFTSYVTSHNLGLSGIGGAAVRYRLYTAWGLSAVEIGEVVAFCGMTFWVGFITLGGVVFVAAPLELPQSIHALCATTRPIGYVFLGLTAAFLAWAVFFPRPLKIRAWELAPPRGRDLGLQVALATLDWAVSAAVLHALLPPGLGVGYGGVFTAYMAAQALGMISHVPAGLGVFDTAILLLIGDGATTPEILGALVLYRAVYYLLPLVLAAGLMITVEVRLQGERFRALQAAVAPIAAAIVPRVIAMTTAMGGVVLLWTGSLPAEGDRLDWLRDFVPLPLIEVSHFLGSLVGAALVILGRGLQRRVDAAWWISVSLLCAGIPLALLRGLDWEEATVCAVALAVMLPFRSAFFRRASLFSGPLRRDWLIGSGMILGGTVWLGLLAFRHVDYQHSLWWHFSWEGDAARFLRASVGAASAFALLGVARLLQPREARTLLPSAADLERVRAVLAKTPDTEGHLALLADKALMFDEDGSAFVMYGTARSTWVAMGDPVGGSPAARRALVWRLLEAAELAGHRAAFYQVSEDSLGMYAEAGFALLKLGEEALVDLATFEERGARKKSLRSSVKRAEREGAAFEVLPPERVAASLLELRAVSDAWLATKNAREKRFSLGFFSPEYLVREPVAVIRSEGRIVAFANLWLGAPGGELSVDLMRHLPDAPGGLMDHLFVRLIEWGREQGYAWFSLGMAPLTGLDQRAAAPLWNRVAGLALRHGEHFYNFQGLRAYKEKFEPVWRPRYLALPRGLALPAVLLDVSSLVSGGIEGILKR